MKDERTGNPARPPSVWGWLDYTRNLSLDSYINLYWMGSRWYDPVLSRWIQPDTIVPLATQGVQAWDRYAAMNNNPTKYTDPSGHKACDGNNQNLDECKVATSDDFADGLYYSYGWQANGNWTKTQLKRLIAVGDDISHYYYQLTGRSGESWIRDKTGNAQFNHGPLKSKSFVIGNQVYLSPYFMSAGKQHVAHELAHVLDNNSAGGGFGATLYGGGLSDKMVQDVGGNPYGGSCVILPLQCGWGYSRLVAGPDPWTPDEAYGNNGIMDDFAETFADTIYLPTIVPLTRLEWMNNFLSISMVP